MNSKYDLEERLLEYAAAVTRVTEQLPASRAGNHIAGQLLRCGTSALPNHAEAQAAESRKDFIHKLRLCHKELRESSRWLRLIRQIPLLEASATADLLDETDELIRIFRASINTASRNDVER